MSPPARAVAGVAVLAGLFLLVAWAALGGSARPFDLAVLHALRAAGRPGVIDFPPWLERASLLVTQAGGWRVRAASLLAALLLLATRSQPRAAAALGAGWVGEVLLVELVKVVAGRDRPGIAWRLAEAGASSFPSGHAAGAMLIYPLAGLLVGRLAGRRAGQAAAAAGVVLALLVGATRVLLGVHWASDVAAGWLLGGAVALLAARAATATEGPN